MQEVRQEQNRRYFLAGILVTSEIKVAEVVVPDWVALPVLTKETTREELPKNLYMC